MSNRPNYWKEYVRPPEYYVKAAEAQRKRRNENPKKYHLINKINKHNQKLKHYELTHKNYEKMLRAQKNCCAICRSSNNNGRDWHIDHEHLTGKVRGILCHHCNLLLGNAKDEIKTLENAIKYLQVQS